MVGLTAALDERGGPASVVAVTASAAQREALGSSGLAAKFVDDVAQLPDESFDDIVYFGASPEVIE